MLQINRKIHEKNLVEILGPMVTPLGGFTWNVPNNHFTLFQLPGNLSKTKKNVLPIFVATRNFLFIFFRSKTVFKYKFFDRKFHADDEKTQEP
jgi:hypothetical protein